MPAPLLSVAAMVGLIVGGVEASAHPASERLIAGTIADAAPALAGVSEGAILRLDLTAPLTGFGAAGRRRTGGEARITEADCPFGPLNGMRSVSPVTGDPHFLLTVAFTSPERHPANLVSCEYAVGADGPKVVLRLRGCFLALRLSVPTASHLLLRPARADACAPRS